MEKQRRSYPWIIAVVAIFLFFFLGKQAQKRRFDSADRGFFAVTGVGLPANLRVASHASDRNDNLFRTTHYWIVQGPIESLRELAPAPGFERSDEDARGELGNVARVMPLGDATLLEGY